MLKWVNVSQPMSDFVNVENKKILADIETLSSVAFKTSDYLSNYPQVFKAAYKDLFFFKYIDNKLVSFCALYPLKFLRNLVDGDHKNCQTLSSYCIGSVCTHPNFQGKGHASKLLQQAISYCKHELAADFVLLFGQDNSFYKKIGFELTGNIFFAPITHQIILDNLPNLVFTQIKNQELSLTQKTNIWQFIINHQDESEPIFSFLEFCDVIKTKNIEIFTLEKESKIKCVAFLHKGDDFKDVIHGIYFAQLEQALYLINQIFNLYKNNLLYLFCGIHKSLFEHYFSFSSLPNMFVLSLNPNKIKQKELITLISEEKISVGSLQGT